ncbi:FCD domain-containing protein [Pusillimonas sp. TS35]|uniref:GntR family transcriptional regulator n=1 Tax=Paracandidimonas lactea TaxID=2895524 RepID=UPI0013679C35|nr:GntR family transcriptional regulator [Paracandidimonas lactea]MYN13896.1 FCD domain-containing protein [Pusillimonas sp. TS35]
MNAVQSGLPPPTTKTEYVYQVLHAEIMAGGLQPGQRLRLAEIAARYTTSEMPVREALRRLQADGLVKFETHRGATVTAVPLARVVEIIATRTFLEVLAISEAMQHHTPASLQKAERINKQLSKATDSKRASELNREFHVQLYTPCRNAFLKQEIDALWDKVWSTQQRSVFERSSVRMPAAVEEHAQILAALRSGSIEQVRHALLIHRQHTMDSWEKQIAESQLPMLAEPDAG